ncbi:MAG: hypothetical protein QOI99_1112 [Actinomycetota bacterium]|nr:hypothetical protein [Actinomycetota bacterium]
MAGKSKHAEQMERLLGEPIEAACPISRPGGTGRQIAGGVGGLAGAVIAGAGKKAGAESDVEIGQFAWLGLGPDGLTLTKSSMMGKPTGDPLLRAPYAEVTDTAVTEGKLTLRVDLDLQDGRHVAFETKRLGQNKPSVEVVELLRARTAGG